MRGIIKYHYSHLLADKKPGDDILVLGSILMHCGTLPTTASGPQKTPDFYSLFKSQLVLSYT
jgi:hypothetical protein